MARKRKKQFRASKEEKPVSSKTLTETHLSNKTGKMLLVIGTGKFYWLYRLIFIGISILFFVLPPFEFIPSLLAGIICVAVFVHLKKIKFEFRKAFEIILFAVVNLYLTCAFFGMDLYLANSLDLSLFEVILYSALCYVWTAFV